MAVDQPNVLNDKASEQPPERKTDEAQSLSASLWEGMKSLVSSDSSRSAAKTDTEDLSISFDSIYKSVTGAAKAAVGIESQPEAKSASAVDVKESKGDSPAPPADKGVTNSPADGNGDHPNKDPETLAPTDNAGPDKEHTYVGEGIKQEVAPSDHTIEKGDTLYTIARDKLGPEATKDECLKYADEIATLNNVSPKKLEVDITLSLPGHDKEGNIITRDDFADSTQTVYADGSRKVVYDDGRSFEHKPGQDGSYVEKHTGPRPEDNYELTRTADGKFLVADKPGDKPREAPNSSEDVRVERSKLENLAEKKIHDPAELAKFRADMARFELRAAEQQPALPAEEIAKTYQEVSRLLEAKNNKEVSPLGFADRKNLAEQIMSNAATPTSIDQGQHPTCTMSTIESRTYNRSPAAAAKLVTDVALTGEYTTPDGKTHVRINPESITANDEEAKRNPPGDGDRTHASQIFQVTAVNVYYADNSFEYKDADGNKKEVPAGQLEYRQIPVEAGNNPPDSGGRLIDNSTNPPTVIMDDWKNSTAEEGPKTDSRDDDSIIKISNKISGKDDAVYLLHEGTQLADPKLATRFENEQQLKDQIIAAKAAGKMPVVMAVHTGNEPFLHDSGGGTAGGSGGWHVVTITDIDEKTGKVSVDNQWGSDDDHKGDSGLSVHDLYLASRRPDHTDHATFLGVELWEKGGTVYEMQKDVDWNREHGAVDTFKEFELLRLKHQTDRISTYEYRTQMTEAMTQAEQRWKEQKANGTFDQNEHDRALQKLSDMTDALPPEDRLWLLQLQSEKGMLPEQKYEDALMKTLADFLEKETDPRKGRAFFNRVVTAVPQDRRQAFINSLQ